MNSKLLLYDHKKADRARGIVDVFCGIFDEIWLVEPLADWSSESSPRWKCYFPKARDVKDLPDSFDLLLLHPESKSDMQSIFDHVDCEDARIVRYSSMPPAKYSNPPEWWINRSLSSDFSSKEEARELLEWSLNKDQSRLPIILQNPHRLPHLISISVLCQGYLAVRRDHVGAVDAMVQEAFSAMGLEMIKDSKIFAKLDEDRNVKIKDTRKPSWWASALEDMTMALQRERDQGGAISKLVKRIDNQTQIDDVELVANAYLEVADILQAQ